MFISFVLSFIYIKHVFTLGIYSEMYPIGSPFCSEVDHFPYFFLTISQFLIHKF